MLKQINWFDFLVGGIVVSFLVNILSSFVQPKILLWWGKHHESRRNKNEAKKRLFSENVEKLINDKHEELVTRIQINRYASFGIYSGVVGLVFLVLPSALNIQNILLNIVCVIVSFFFLSTSISTFSKRNELVDLINVVDKNLGRNFL